MNANEITCPHCGFIFPLESAISHQLEATIRKELEEKIRQDAEFINASKKALEKEREEFQKHMEAEEAIIAAKVKAKLESEKAKLNDTLEEKYKEQVDALKKENSDGKVENRIYRQKEVVLLQKEQQLKDREEDLKLEVDRQMLLKRREIAEEVIKREQTRHELHLRELEKKLEDQVKLATEMQRKAEQGSQQLQGEVLELAIEEFLRENFFRDEIKEVKKGERGGDYIHTVNNEFNRVCGKIIYECKRTKNFMNGWIEKLKIDQKESGCDIAVLVTESMPSDMPSIGMKDGVWICSYTEFKALVFALRYVLVREFVIRQSEENKGDKMSLLYKYLTGTEFRSCVENVVQGSSDMRTALHKEKTAMAKLYKEREKQIDKILGSTVDMYGSISGIAGTMAIPSIKLLELENVSPGDLSADQAIQ